MDIQSRKIEFIQEFLKLQNEDLITKFEDLLYNEVIVQKNLILQPISIDELNQRIDLSLNDSLNNRLTESIDLFAEIKKWD